MDRGRKKSGKQEDSPLVQAAKEEVLPGYEEYLVLLQERNRLLKRLRQKDKNKIDQERREQGFSLYVNGPHKDGKPTSKSPGKQATIPTQPAPKTSRKPKTAGEYPRNQNVLDNRALEEITRQELERQKEMSRAKTAPSARERRRNWNVDSSVEIRTTKGGQKIKAPEILSGRYADDFEPAEESDEFRSSDDENSADESPAQSKYKKPVRKPPPPRESDMFNSSDSYNSEEDSLGQDSEGDDLEIDASKFSRQSNSSPRKSQKASSRKGRQTRNDSDDDDDGFGGSEKLLLSMKELKTLRQSLVKNATIRQSLARDNSSEDDFIPESPIPEVEEDLPSDDDYSPEDSPRRNINLNKPTMKPNDTIVLEFGGSGNSSNKKIEKNLSAARRKDLDEGEYSSNIGRQRPSSEKQNKIPPKVVERSQSAKTLLSDNAGKKSVRPLSANRRTPDQVWTDPDNEASAVMAALKQENAQASKHKQTPRQRSSPNVLGSNKSKPQYDRSEMPPRSHQVRQSESPRSSVSSSSTEPLVPMEKINQIMEKVLRMSPRHQRRLVNMLGKIEKSVVTESLENPIPKPRSKPRTSSDGPMRAVHRSTNKSSEDESVIEIHIEVTSNWGHSMRLGLTEIQVYDQNNTLLPISAADVTVHGAEECKGTLDLLFNGKFKTNKERNMWSCRYHARRPVEFMINVRNPNPKSGEVFSLSQMKIWNFNKSIAELDIGVKDVRVFVGTELVFSGPVEKGCGNQVFDYCHVIPLKPQGALKNGSNPEIEVEKADSPEVPVPKKRSSAVSSSSTEKINRKRMIEERRKENLTGSSSRDSVEQSVDKSRNRPPVSPRGERSPSPAPKFPVNKSPREPASVNHRSISPRPSQDRKKTFRSISMSSQSSASSGGESAPNSRPTSGLKSPAARSETRTINHPVLGKNASYSNQGSDSLSENEDGPGKGHMPGKMRGVKTPRKSKRMAARLDGLGSTDVDSSKSLSESTEKKLPPPLPPRKSEEKVAKKPVQKSSEDKSQKASVQASKGSNKTGKSTGNKDNVIDEKKVVADLAKKQESESELEETLKAGGNTTVSSSVSVASSQDDTPMLQKLKDMNKKDQTNSRKKDVPRWLKQEDISGPFENPPESRDGVRPEPVKVEVQKPPPTQEEINMLIDEEMSLFPEQKKSAKEPEHAMDTSEGDNTPMSRIQKNRSKWRENPSMNLEESWGSLSQFNKCQRGRLSLDMDDDVLDEYINKAAKLAGLPTEPAIPEEEGTMEQPANMSIDDSDDEMFTIPELPYGRELVMNIRTTWGDKHYVGFTGIEVFSSTGEQVSITKIHADPSDINILSEYNKDPRVVKNLIDGTNRTRDDIHMWLAPYTAGKDHLVFFTLEKACKIALIRIWNYNKSRIHSYRGAKDVIMTLDSSVIFKGEIARACGGVEGGTEAFGDTILFTTDEAILEAVSQNDEAYEGEMLSDDEPFDVERPSTADAGDDKERPFTRAVGNIKQLEREPTVAYEGNMMVYHGRCIELNFTATWGDLHYLGLTGLEVVGKEGEAIPVNIDMISAIPRDVTSLPGHERDDRTLDKVIDGTNVTLSDEHMWLVPFAEGNNHVVTIDFGEKVYIAGLRIWNYNKSKEDTYRGARILHVAIDNKVVSPDDGFLVRKGLGTCHFDFAQEISFSPQSWNPSAGLSALGPSPSIDESQNYEVVQMPCGFIYQLQLFSTWGDTYYVGLNGIELFDGNLQKIQLTESNISAYPDSVNVLEKIQNDVRTPDKLIDGVNDTMDGGHMWLAPILPGHLNRVYVIFDQPTSISMIKIWNYSKTANRGAKDFALLVDDLLVYNGVLQAVTTGARGILPTCEGPQAYHTILFTNNKDILRKEKNTIINNHTGEQDVQMTNDKKIVSHYNDPKKATSGKPVDQNLRPTTSVIHSKKRR
ncbi:katanin-interacting protein-like isoform X2 [Ruditapes philippinarum]|uniref:katanin-interacting protein-like isoform X2 n=1 Tax=Ruditapes philippinarum TaxID=129788 RepID=UPI00295A84C9|nr:katanin-interacting protein-like isoform X2 [Ruditapes philippinarum]